MKICWKNRKGDEIIDASETIACGDETVTQLIYVPERLKWELLRSKKLLQDVFDGIYWSGQPITFWHGNKCIGKIIQLSKNIKYRHFKEIYADTDRTIPIMCSEDILIRGYANKTLILPEDIDTICRKLADNEYTPEQIKEMKSMRDEKAPHRKKRVLNINKKQINVFPYRGDIVIPPICSSKLKLQGETHHVN